MAFKSLFLHYVGCYRPQSKCNSVLGADIQEKIIAFVGLQRVLLSLIALLMVRGACGACLCLVAPANMSPSATVALDNLLISDSSWFTGIAPVSLMHKTIIIRCLRGRKAKLSNIDGWINIYLPPYPFLFKYNIKIQSRFNTLKRSQ